MLGGLEEVQLGEALAVVLARRPLVRATDLLSGAQKKALQSILRVIEMVLDLAVPGVVVYL